MNVGLLMLSLLCIMMETVSVTGFLLMYLKKKKDLYLWCCLLFVALIVDDILGLTGSVFPALSYLRAIASPYSLPVALLKEGSSILIFFLVRMVLSEAVGPKISRMEKVLWGICLVVVLVMKTTPCSQQFPFLLGVFLLYNMMLFASVIAGLVSVIHRRVAFSPGSFQFWISLLVAVLGCYLASFIVELGVLLGAWEALGFYLSNLIWYAILVVALVFLAAQLSQRRKQDMAMELFAVKRYYQLTDRETEIFSLLLLGKTNNEISEELFIALGTTKTHIHNLYKKLGITKRTQLSGAVTTAVAGQDDHTGSREVEPAE